MKVMKMSKVRFRGQKQVIVMLNKEVYAKAGSYTSNGSCPIATAVNSHFRKIDNVSVGAKRITITHNKKSYQYRILGSCAGSFNGGPGGGTFIGLMSQYGIQVPIVLELRPGYNGID